MTPYYQDYACTIYHGDCREILPAIDAPTTIVTDPTWPNASVPLYGHHDPQSMFAEMFAALPVLPMRIAAQLGCDSDPRFLMAVPAAIPFFRTAWLEVVRMGYRGRLGHTGDVGYLFGSPPPSRPGARIIPGRCTDTSNNGKQSSHPCPRKLAHVEWLVRWWSEPGEIVCDPFAGSGTTGKAAKDNGRKAVLIEIEERYCEIAAKRLSQEVMQFPTSEPLVLKTLALEKEEGE